MLLRRREVFAAAGSVRLGILGLEALDKEQGWKGGLANEREVADKALEVARSVGGAPAMDALARPEELGRGPVAARPGLGDEHAGNRRSIRPRRSPGAETWFTETAP